MGDAITEGCLLVAKLLPSLSEHTCRNVCCGPTTKDSNCVERPVYRAWWVGGVLRGFHQR